MRHGGTLAACAVAGAICAACAGSQPAPATTAAVSPAPAGGAAAAGDPAARQPPSSAFTWTCDVGRSGGQENVVAVKDAGSSFTFAMGASTDGPFEAVDGDDRKNLFRTVIDGEALRDPDFAAFYAAASVKDRTLVSQVVVYAFVVRAPWSFGIAVARDAKGHELGHAGWTMRPANARPCAR